jgi:hypothetical protein
MIAHYPLRKHYPYTRVKTPTRIVLDKNIPFVKASMPSSLAYRLVEDRDWKEANLMWVPVMAQWQLVQAQWKTMPGNGTPVKLSGVYSD